MLTNSFKALFGIKQIIRPLDCSGFYSTFKDLNWDLLQSNTFSLRFLQNNHPSTVLYPHFLASWNDDQNKKKKNWGHEQSHHVMYVITYLSQRAEDLLGDSLPRLKISFLPNRCRSQQEETTERLGERKQTSGAESRDLLQLVFHLLFAFCLLPGFPPSSFSISTLS